MLSAFVIMPNWSIVICLPSTRIKDCSLLVQARDNWQRIFQRILINTEYIQEHSLVLYRMYRDMIYLIQVFIENFFGNYANDNDNYDYDRNNLRNLIIVNWLFSFFLISHNPLIDFKPLTSTCSYFRGCPIDRLDVAIAYDLPELVGKYKKLTKCKLDQN